MSQDRVYELRYTPVRGDESPDSLIPEGAWAPANAGIDRGPKPVNRNPRQVLPAHAGIDQSRGRGCSYWPGVPRANGDRPQEFARQPGH